MSTLSTSAWRSTGAWWFALGTLFVVLTGCASHPASDMQGEPGSVTSKYEAQKNGGAAANSDAVHVPPVAHDPKLEKIAGKAMGEYARALQTLAQGKQQQALVMFQSLASRYPQLSGPQVNVGLIYLHQKKFKQAQNALEKAISINQANPYAHNALGLTLREQGKFKQARQQYEAALALDPEYARAHFNLAVLGELYLQDLNLALAHFQAYQKLQKNADENVANWIVDLKRRAPKAPSQPVADSPAPTSNAEVN
ncbi:MAG: tetratricopeptide repeat protein [Alcanivorax sp.]|nr:tetratricopeptide repeat protein [Alcanivorax sp.]